MISVVYAEDQTIVRRGIVALLETTPDVRVIGEAVDGDQALAMIRKLHPDVALLDIRMPKRSGIEVLKELNKSGWAPHTIFLTTFDEDPLFLQAVQAGALGFFLKDVTVERLAHAIRVVATGKPMLRERYVNHRGLGCGHAQSPVSFRYGCAKNRWAISLGNR